MVNASSYALSTETVGGGDTRSFLLRKNVGQEFPIPVSLLGIIPADITLEEAREERLRKI